MSRAAKALVVMKTKEKQNKEGKKKKNKVFFCLRTTFSINVPVACEKERNNVNNNTGRNCFLNISLRPDVNAIERDKNKE